MKLDSVLAKIMITVGNKHQIPSEKVDRIMTAYFKGVKQIIDTSEEATVIKLDYFGKIVFNEQKAKKNQIEKEKSIARKNNQPLQLDESFSIKPRD